MAKNDNVIPAMGDTNAVCRHVVHSRTSHAVL